VQTCIWPSWCHCHSLSLASVKSRLVLPFWYWLTRVVPEKGRLNGCVFQIIFYQHYLLQKYRKKTRHSMLPVFKKKIHKCLGIKNCSYLLNCFESEITRFTEKQTEIFELINFTNGMQNYHGSGTSSQHIVTLDYCALYKYWWSEWHWKKYTGQL